MVSGERVQLVDNFPSMTRWSKKICTGVRSRSAAGVATEARCVRSGYSFGASNVRHEHEWRLWERTRLPDGKMILPGVVSHSTNLIEHPELIADRIMRFARLVGRENVIAGTDCGLGGRVHAEIAWAKLGALAEGAKLASSKLWG